MIFTKLNFSEYKLFLVFLFLNILDVLTTMYIINTNQGHEGNIIPAMALEYGVTGLIILKLIGIMMILAVIHYSGYDKSLIAYPSMIIGMAVLWNILVIL